MICITRVKQLPGFSCVLHFIIFGVAGQPGEHCVVKPTSLLYFPFENDDDNDTVSFPYCYFMHWEHVYNSPLPYMYPRRPTKLGKYSASNPPSSGLLFILLFFHPTFSFCPSVLPSVGGKSSSPHRLFFFLMPQWWCSGVQPLLCYGLEAARNLFVILETPLLRRYYGSVYINKKECIDVNDLVVN